MRRLGLAALSTVLSCGLSGCWFHKKPAPPVLPQSTAPVALETPPSLDKQPVIEAPKPKLPEVPVAEAASKPKRVRRKPKVKEPAVVAAPPSAPAQQGADAGGVQVATGDSPSGDSVIGELTPSGGDQSPQAQQDAADLLASTDKRLNALSDQMKRSQRAQISKIRNFWKQGHQALKSGDAEGAKTLAVKAKLLLDDLEKAGG